MYKAGPITQLAKGKIEMATGDIKLLAANAITLAISMTHIEVGLKSYSAIAYKYRIYSN